LTRWVVAVLAALLLIAAGYVMFLNPERVVVHLSPGRVTQPPLAGALLTAFAAGAVLVGLAVAVRASSRGVRAWRTERHARRERDRARTTARAQELVWAGDYAQARAELLRAERGIPADPARLVLLAETYLHENDPAGARKLLDEGLHKVGLEPRLLALLAESAERSGDVRGAADALERARQAQPDSPRLARRLRDIYAASQRWPEALALQGEILLKMHDPASLAAEERVLRGLRYQSALAETDPKRAARLLVGLTREDRTFLPAWVSAGDVLAAAGRRLTARRVWERGARQRPDGVLLERIEQLNASEGRPERTTRLYRRLLRRHPNTPGVALLFARHLIGKGELAEAEQVLSAIPAPDSGDGLVHALWGELHRRRGNHSLAADSFARAMGTEGVLGGPFRCVVCRRAADSWLGYCPECRQWGTYRARANHAGQITS
jgi:tetratricopeptide (TPR) repeat protein